MLNKQKRAQVTIFIIVAVLIVLGIIIYFMVRSVYVEELPRELQPAYDVYLDCIQGHAEQGVAFLGEQGGHIELPEFVPGSQYMPFSSQLDFLGQPVPYWMYVSGNNLLKEQVPTKTEMEKELEDYVESRLEECDFSDFNTQGYDIFVEVGEVSVDIKELSVELSVDNLFTIYFEDQSAKVSSHKVSFNTKLGKFYKLALDVYNFEKSTMFLEEYALDVLKLNVPVTGVDVSCSPRIFVDDIIRENLTSALETNVMMLKLKGDYYELANKENEYYVTDIGDDVGENVNFIYSSDWPTRVEIYGDRVVEPVGLQEGLGVLGFCYVPYHLVYDVDFPVLIQFYDGEEIFQFPIAVVIDKTQARNALPSTAGTSIEPEVCEYKNQEVTIYTYDSNLNSVEADIKFKCLNSECRIGKTSIEGGEAVLNENLPQCVNGFIVASAEGYADAKYQISTNTESSASLIMNKLYDVQLDLGNVDKAMVSFKSDGHTASVMYPVQKDVELIEGYYNVSVYAYKNSSLKFPATSDRKCFDVPKEGVAGMFGAEEEKCFDINFPETEVTHAVVGGGKTQEYMTENMLAGSNELNINVPLFGIPSNLDELQNNYLEVEEAIVYLTFE